MRTFSGLDAQVFGASRQRARLAALLAAALLAAALLVTVRPVRGAAPAESAPPGTSAAAPAGSPAPAPAAAGTAGAGTAGAGTAGAAAGNAAGTAAAGGASAASPAASAPAAAAAQPTRVKVSTSVGDFVIELQADRAPLTVANFLRYVREGFYANTLFHRVISNFVVQGGGHDATDMKLKPVHDPVFNESGNGLQNKRGTVGLARGDAPHSGNAQFFVNLVDNPDLDPLPTRWGYAVFGRVVQGMDVLDRIGVTPTGTAGPFKADAPLKPVVILKVEPVDALAAGSSSTTTMPAPRADSILSPK